MRFVEIKTPKLPFGRIGNSRRRANGCGPWRSSPPMPMKLVPTSRPYAEMLGAAFQVDLMGMWPIARVNKSESDNPSILESVELATDSSGPSEEPIRRLIVHFAWERGHLRRNPAMSLVM